MTPPECEWDRFTPHPGVNGGYQPPLSNESSRREKTEQHGDKLRLVYPHTPQCEWSTTQGTAIKKSLTAEVLTRYEGSRLSVEASASAQGLAL